MKGIGTPMNRKGFTLIELAAVIIIIGLLLVPLVQLYTQYKGKKEVDITIENMAAINGLISKFVLREKRFPCPADASLARDDPQYGRELNPSCNPELLGTSVALDSCAMDGGVCYVRGERDVDSVAGNDPVVIGSIPIITIRDSLGGEMVAVAHTMDGWGSNIAYAVTQNQAVAATFNFGNGVIRAENEYGDVTAGINNDADYALISRGPNRVAGHSESGGRFHPCGTPLSGLENENCDLDAVFIKALKSTAQGPNYYDDFVTFGKIKNYQLWIENNIEGYIYNANTGVVGINNDFPQHMLDVAGAIEVNENTRSDLICTKPGPTDTFDPDRHCFDIGEITDATVACPGEALVAINDLSSSNPNPKYTCKPLNFVSNLKPNQSCPNLNEWIVGFTSEGDIICEVP